MSRIGYFLLLLLSIQAKAQGPRSRSISGAEAQQFEAVLKGNPNDRAARSALLTYYFIESRLDPASAIQARRNHILWLIQNASDDPMLSGSTATIDAAGHRLADPSGYQLASGAWRARIGRQDVNANTLGNAAFFFKLSDKPFTISLLERALLMEPANPQLGAFLGSEYAMAILGVTMVNQNGYPTGSDPRLTQSETSKRARQALETTQNVYQLAQAGYILSFQGAILRGSGHLPFDANPLAERVLQRAVSLAPRDQYVTQMMAQHREIQAALSQRRAR